MAEGTVKCKNCGHPIRLDQGSPTGWTHGRWPMASDWQGKRCPRRLTGAESEIPLASEVDCKECLDG